ncbi:ADP-ribosylglycohydrolase family protein [bacterium]|nr:ADP-ribosylglycohydrolase family protein [bacterium]
MPILKLSQKTYLDKVLGCWYGKNAGGTLGGPWEKMWGMKEPFKVEGYLNIQEGGIPNDDLEIQLVWLQALEERGLDITCRDLAEYWLDCIWYNPDEYGFHKTNLRLGLSPPVSGWFNNPAKDCMGSPIRSEIWACIAPGLPHIAAAYAWHDAVCDHAGGEGVFGEMYNAALESAAFLISDVNKLIEIGLSMIPPDCLTAKAIKTVCEAKAQGLSWLETRERLLERFYSPNAQFAPLNLGFQTIGLLYGEDFGDALCKAVSCGYDTDCNGATVGAILGIIYGANALPREWIAPLGNTISTNASWGGIRNIRIPQTVEELTERVAEICRKLLARYENIISFSSEDDFSGIFELDLINPQKARDIYTQSPNANKFVLTPLEVIIEYPCGPVIYSEQPTPIIVHFRNLQKEPLSIETRLDLPPGFDRLQYQEVELPPNGEVEMQFSIIGPQPRYIGISNYCWLRLLIKGRPIDPALPVVFVGARRFLVSPLFSGATLETPLLIREGGDIDEESLHWTIASWPEYELKIEPFFNNTPGVVFLKHWVKSPCDRMVRVGVPNSYRMKLWVNDILAKETEKIVPVRPSYWGDESNNADVQFRKGWNSVLIKLERGNTPIHAYLTFAEPSLCAGLWDIIQTRFPWEEA